MFGFGTLIWYFGTQDSFCQKLSKKILVIFLVKSKKLTFKIGDLTGSCFDSNDSQILEIKTLRSCKSVFGSRWESFDISGHTFLLIWETYRKGLAIGFFQD